MTPLLGPENDAKKSPPKTGFSVDFDPGRPYKAKKKNNSRRFKTQLLE